MAKARELASPASDCAEAIVMVEQGVATLTFTTKDGRRTVRVLRDPRDLSPLLEALEVTLPSAATAARGPDARPATTAPRRNPAPASGATRGARVLLQLLGGARFAGPSPLLGPSLIAGAAAELPGWELGATAFWAPRYAVLGEADRAVHVATLAAGVAAGRRVPLGAASTFVFGASLCFATQHEGYRTADAGGASVHVDDDRGVALVGTYAGVALAAGSGTRIRLEVLGDLDSTHAADDDDGPGGVPRAPWWTATLAAGVEGEVL